MKALKDFLAGMLTVLIILAIGIGTTVLVILALMVTIESPVRGMIAIVLAYILAGGLCSIGLSKD